jgi:hypothetical protein
MSFYQNPFDFDFQQNLPFSDRQYNITFKCPANKNTSNIATCWNSEPYDLSSVNTLTFYTSVQDFKNWATFSVNVAGATPSATTAAEIVAILNANSSFAGYFTASVSNGKVRIQSISNLQKYLFRFYLSNNGAETKLKFNKHAGVADMPTYVDRHTIANRFNGTAKRPAEGILIKLSHPITTISVAGTTTVTSASHGLTTGDVIYVVNSNSTPSIDGQRTVTVTGTNTFTVPVTVTTAGTRGEWLSTIEYNVVADYGLDYTTMKEDYEHLDGRVGLFSFQKITVDGTDRITQIIEYQAGAVVGDLGRKINYSYTSSNTKPDQITEIPYILASGDLITPS